jgi:surfeit locus 1 family protein
MKRVVPILLATLLGLAILCSLGFWQLRRLQEKEILLAQIASRLDSPAIEFAQQGLDEFHKVSLTGSYLPAPVITKLTTWQGSAAYQIIQPFHTTGNVVVLVDRGAIGIDDKASIDAPRNVTFEAVLRRHNKGRGFFDQDNQPASNQWYWWDVKTMLAEVDLPAGTIASDWIAQRLPLPGEKPPMAQPPKVELRNTHLGYAITWFGLAAALLVVSAIFIHKQLQRTAP